jgi:hypothetical protein
MANGVPFALPSITARLGAYLAHQRRFNWSAKTQDRPHNPAQILAGNDYRTDSAQDMVFAQSRTSFSANYCTKMQ